MDENENCESEPTHRNVQLDVNATDGPEEVLLCSSDLDCPLCLRMLHDPLTISCGHTFCRWCLSQALDTKHECPLCRCPTFVEASSHASTALLVRLINNHFPNQSRVREQELRVERTQSRPRRDIFFTDKVYLPFQTVQLYIFEPRYRVMISRALSTQREFLFVVATPENQSHESEGLIGEIAAVCGIRHCSASADGRSFVQGVISRLVKLSTPQPVEYGYGLMSAAIEPQLDLPEEVEEEPVQARRIWTAFQRYRDAVNRYDVVVAAKLPKIQEEEALAMPLSDLVWTVAAELPDAASPQRGSRRLLIRSEPSLRCRADLALQWIDGCQQRLKESKDRQSYVVAALMVFALAYVLTGHSF